MRNAFKITVLTLALSAFLICCYTGYILKTNNFHSITPGEAYRSAQPDREDIEYYIKTYKIKSIVNLRGRNPDEQWYREEMQVSAEHGVAHYDISLSSSREPSAEDIQKLMEIFRTAPRPVLIHCKAGADRSGLAAAIWKAVVDKEPKSIAEKQLSVFYGHIPIRGTYAMDHFFQKWAVSGE